MAEAAAPRRGRSRRHPAARADAARRPRRGGRRPRSPAGPRRWARSGSRSAARSGRCSPRRRPTSRRRWGRLSPAAVEWKLDGIRVQVHRDGDDVARLQPLARRHHRARSRDGAAAPALPVRARSSTARRSRCATTAGRTCSRSPRSPRNGGVRPQFFDLLHADGDDLLDPPGAARAAVLAAVYRRPCGSRGVAPTPPTGAASWTRRWRGPRGTLVKSLDAPYAAGRRGAGWLKVKPVHTLDLVVLAAEWGHGRRRGWLSNLHLGARHDSGQAPRDARKDLQGPHGRDAHMADRAPSRAGYGTRRLGRPRPPRARCRDRLRRHPEEHPLPRRRRAALRARAAPPARQARRGGRHAGRGAGGPARN